MGYDLVDEIDYARVNRCDHLIEYTKRNMEPKSDLAREVSAIENERADLMFAAQIEEEDAEQRAEAEARYRRAERRYRDRAAY